MWYKLTEDQISDFSKRSCYNGLMWAVKHREEFFNIEGTIKNVETGIKKHWSELSYEEYDREKYPLFGVNAKTQKLQTEKGFTNILNYFIKGIDGFWYCKKLENIVSKNINIPFSTFYDGCIYESIQEEAPQFPINEEE
jgi:hypothetical protein